MPFHALLYMTAIEKVGIGAACTKLEVRASEENSG